MTTYNNNVAHMQRLLDAEYSIEDVLRYRVVIRNKRGELLHRFVELTMQSFVMREREGDVAGRQLDEYLLSKIEQRMCIPCFSRRGRTFAP